MMKVADLPERIASSMIRQYEQVDRYVRELVEGSKPEKSVDAVAALPSNNNRKNNTHGTGDIDYTNLVAVVISPTVVSHMAVQFTIKEFAPLKIFVVR